MSGGPYFLSNNLFEYSQCLPIGVYEFNILDSAGNGLANDDYIDGTIGEYNVYMNDAVISTGIAFGASKSTIFNVVVPTPSSSLSPSSTPSTLKPTSTFSPTIDAKVPCTATLHEQDGVHTDNVIRIVVDDNTFVFGVQKFDFWKMVAVEKNGNHINNRYMSRDNEFSVENWQQANSYDSTEYYLTNILFCQMTERPSVVPSVLPSSTPPSSQPSNNPSLKASDAPSSRPSPTTGMERWVVFEATDVRKLNHDTLIGEFTPLSINYELSFTIISYGTIQDWGSILRFTAFPDTGEYD